MSFKFDDRFAYIKAEKAAYEVGKDLLRKENETLSKVFLFVMSLLMPFVSYEP